MLVSVRRENSIYQGQNRQINHVVEQTDAGKLY